MNNKNRKIITRILIIIMTLILIGIMIYSFITIKKVENIELSKEIKIYLNESYKNEKVKSKSPILGLLNFNFNNLNTISTNNLIYTNFMSSSQMNENEIDNIYKGTYLVPKKVYSNSNDYIENQNTNCYYYQNNLKKEEFNCNEICSKNTTEIMNVISEKLQWSNISYEDVKTFCIKNPKFSLEENGYFVNLNEVKKLYKSITNKELIFDEKIINNQYFEYDGYLETESLRLEDNINEITNILSLTKKMNNYIVSYEAQTDALKKIRGTLTLEKNNNKYYIISNKIETNNYLN